MGLKGITANPFEKLFSSREGDKTNQITDAEKEEFLSHYTPNNQDLVTVLDALQSPENEGGLLSQEEVALIEAMEGGRDFLADVAAHPFNWNQISIFAPPSEGGQDYGSFGHKIKMGLDDLATHTGIQTNYSPSIFNENLESADYIFLSGIAEGKYNSIFAKLHDDYGISRLSLKSLVYAASQLQTEWSWADPQLIKPYADLEQNSPEQDTLLVLVSKELVLPDISSWSSVQQEVVHQLLNMGIKDVELEQLLKLDPSQLQPYVETIVFIKTLFPDYVPNNPIREIERFVPLSAEEKTILTQHVGSLRQLYPTVPEAFSFKENLRDLVEGEKKYPGFFDALSLYGGIGFDFSAAHSWNLIKIVEKLKDYESSGALDIFKQCNPNKTLVKIRLSVDLSFLDKIQDPSVQLFITKLLQKVTDPLQNIYYFSAFADGVPLETLNRALDANPPIYNLWSSDAISDEDIQKWNVFYGNLCRDFPLGPSPFAGLSLLDRDTLLKNESIYKNKFYQKYFNEYAKRLDLSYEEARTLIFYVSDQVLLTEEAYNKAMAHLDFFQSLPSDPAVRLPLFFTCISLNDADFKLVSSFKERGLLQNQYQALDLISLAAQYPQIIGMDSYEPILNNIGFFADQNKIEANSGSRIVYAASWPPEVSVEECINALSPYIPKPISISELFYYASFQEEREALKSPEFSNFFKEVCGHLPQLNPDALDVRTLVAIYLREPEKKAQLLDPNFSKNWDDFNRHVQVANIDQRHHLSSALWGLYYPLPEAGWEGFNSFCNPAGGYPLVNTPEVYQMYVLYETSEKVRDVLKQLKEDKGYGETLVYDKPALVRTDSNRYTDQRTTWYYINTVLKLRMILLRQGITPELQTDMTTHLLEDVDNKKTEFAGTFHFDPETGAMSLHKGQLLVLGDGEAHDFDPLAPYQFIKYHQHALLEDNSQQAGPSVGEADLETAVKLKNTAIVISTAGRENNRLNYNIDFYGYDPEIGGAGDVVIDITGKTSAATK